MIESKTSVSVVNNDDKQNNNGGKYGDEFNHINVFGISPHKNVFAHLKVYGVCHDKYGEHDESVDVNNVDLVCRNIHLMMLASIDAPVVRHLHVKNALKWQILTLYLKLISVGLRLRHLK